MRPVRFIICLCILGNLAFGEVSPFESRLPRTNLLGYHTARGRIATVKTESDWQKRRLEILESMQQIMGPMPGKEKRSALDVNVSENIDSGSYVRQFLTYSSQPGCRTPAYLLIPKNALHGRRKLPAILALHPTDMKFGHRVVVEQLRDNYRAYGRDLAERGYVVFAPAYPSMADYQPDLKNLGYSSGTMKAIWDNIRPGSSRVAPLRETRQNRRNWAFPWGTQCDFHCCFRFANQGCGLKLRVRFIRRLLRWKHCRLDK